MKTLEVNQHFLPNNYYLTIILMTNRRIPASNIFSFVIFSVKIGTQILTGRRQELDQLHLIRYKQRWKHSRSINIFYPIIFIWRLFFAMNSKKMRWSPNIGLMLSGEEVGVILSQARVYFWRKDYLKMKCLIKYLDFFDCDWKGN